MKISTRSMLCFILFVSFVAAAKIICECFVAPARGAFEQQKIIDLKNNEQSFNAWYRSCNFLPMYKKNSENPYKTILDESALIDQMDQFFETMHIQFQNMYWINGVRPIVNSSEMFNCYVQKLVVPDDAIIAIHGDLHGDIHSLNNFIKSFCDKGFLDKKDPFKIIDSRFYILFLGDYVDRGWYGAEVLYAILRLKNENPDRVFMVRGNHEDVNLNDRYGFTKELKAKFSSQAIFDLCNDVYNVLPVAVYLGSGNGVHYDFVQCCHGGIELGFNPLQLLDNAHNFAGMKFSFLDQANGFVHISKVVPSSFKNYFRNKTSVDQHNGFMWNDFIVDSHTPLLLSSRDGKKGTFFEFGKDPTEKILQALSGKTYTLRAIFRAHQHSCLKMRARILNQDNLSHSHDKGIGKLWIEGSIHRSMPSLLDNVAVVTFSVAPYAGYEWPVHAFGQLRVASDYEDWRLQVVSR